MKLEVLRFSSQKDSTNGLLFDITDGREFLAYTLEDEKREDKVMHETRIPAGTYKIKLRTVGGFHGRYEKKYGSMHKGMLHVQDVPGFEYILIRESLNDFTICKVLSFELLSFEVNVGICIIPLLSMLWEFIAS